MIWVDKNKEQPTSVIKYNMLGIVINFTNNDSQ